MFGFGCWFVFGVGNSADCYACACIVRILYIFVVALFCLFCCLVWLLGVVYLVCGLLTFDYFVCYFVCRLV